LHLGLIAQEVEEVFPEIVSESLISKMKGVNYTEIIPVLVKQYKNNNPKSKNLKPKLKY
jgi:hypothetical protein